MASHTSCERQCAQKLAACQQLARQAYDQLRQQCQGIPDPTTQAACLTSAAQSYKAMLEACQAEYQVCLQICRGGYYP